MYLEDQLGYFSVSVGNYLPIFKFSPLSLPLVLETFFMYPFNILSVIVLTWLPTCCTIVLSYALVNVSLTIIPGI